MKIERDSPLQYYYTNRYQSHFIIITPLDLCGRSLNIQHPCRLKDEVDHANASVLLEYLVNELKTSEQYTWLIAGHSYRATSHIFNSFLMLDLFESAFLFIGSCVGERTVLLDVCFVPRLTLLVEEDLIDAFEGNVGCLRVEEVDRGHKRKLLDPH